MPILRRVSLRSVRRSQTFSPKTVTAPSVGVSSRLMQRSSVDLPVPEGPITVMTSPRFMEAFTSVSGTAPGKAFFRCSILISSPSPKPGSCLPASVPGSHSVAPRGSLLGRLCGSMLSSIRPMPEAIAAEIAKYITAVDMSGKNGSNVRLRMRSLALVRSTMEM